MSATTYLFIANAAVWLGIAGYLVFLASKSAGLEKRVQQLEVLGAIMTDSTVNLSKKAIILFVVGAAIVMFAVSFLYRMDNPNLFVKVQQQHSADDGHDHGEEDAMPPAGMGQGAEAMGMVKEYMARVDANPEDVEALIGLGNSFLMMRAWDRALEPLQKANVLEPGNTKVLAAIGISSFNKKDFTSAAEAYEQILVIDPADTLALFNLGIINKHYFDKPERAKKYFEEVLKLEKEDTEMIKLAKQEMKS